MKIENKTHHEYLNFQTEFRVIFIKFKFFKLVFCIDFWNRSFSLNEYLGSGIPDKM